MSDNPRRMPFPAKYSAAQNESIIGAQLDDGMTAADAVAAAAAGELEHAGKPLAPFEMPWRTARDKASEAKRIRKTVAAAAAGIDGALDVAAARVVALLQAEIELAEKRRRAGRLTPEAITSLARATREVSAMLRGINGKAKVGAAPVNGDGADFVGDLAGKLQQ